MSRLLVLLLVGLAIAYVLSEGIRRLQSAIRANLAPPEPAPAEPPRASHDLVRCEGCGIYLPQQRALLAAESAQRSPASYFCSEACRRASLRSA